MTKEFIDENMFNSKGKLKPGIAKKFNSSNQELYNIYKNISSPKCTCGEPRIFKSFTKGYLVSCGSSKCKNNLTNKSVELSEENLHLFISKSGGINSRALKIYGKTSKEIFDFKYPNKEKVCIMCSENYIFKNYKIGYKKTCKCKNYCKIKIKPKTDWSKAREKGRKTNLERYGVENATNVKKIKETKKERYQDENYNNPEKHKEVCLEKYGATTYFNSESGKVKSKKSKKERYCNENYCNVEKIKETKKTKYNNRFLEEERNQNIEDYYNVSNYNLLFKSYIEEKFLKDKRFNLIAFKNFYSCSTNFAYKILRDLGIDYNKKFSVEKEINTFFGNIFEGNTRQIIKPLELDLYSEKYNFAIEYNGLMWHSYGKSKYTTFDNLEKEDPYKHLKKTELCEEKGIDLFHIFEHEWLDETKKSIWISVINEELGKNLEIDYTKCTIKYSTKEESEVFLIKNDLEGFKNANIYIGLYYNNELVSLMSIETLDKNSEYKIINFASKKGYSIQKSFGILLEFFEQEFNPYSVIFPINRRFISRLYEKEGFVELYCTKPNCFYFLPNSGLIYEQNIRTEKPFQEGYRRIWDSGTKFLIKKY